MNNYRNTDKYKSFRKQFGKLSAGEKLVILRYEFIRLIGLIEGYNDLLLTLELDGSPETFSEFKELTQKITDASLELKAAFYGLTD